MVTTRQKNKFNRTKPSNTIDNAVEIDLHETHTPPENQTQNPLKAYLKTLLPKPLKRMRKSLAKRVFDEEEHALDEEDEIEIRDQTVTEEEIANDNEENQDSI